MSVADDPTVEVTDNPEQHRFEVRLNSELAGFAVYRRKPGLIAFIHTEIEDRFGGHGLATTLIQTALDTCRSDGLAVLPFCPFVDAYIKRHPDYVDLVPESQRKAFDL